MNHFCDLALRTEERTNRRTDKQNLIHRAPLLAPMF